MRLKHRRGIDLVQLPAEHEGFAVLSTGEIDALVFRLRPGRLAEDLAIAIDAWTPPATIPASVAPKDPAKDPHPPMVFAPPISIAWVKDVLPPSMTQTVGVTKIEVVYSRPGVKGRTIWGATARVLSELLGIWSTL